MAAEVKRDPVMDDGSAPVKAALHLSCAEFGPTSTRASTRRLTHEAQVGTPSGIVNVSSQRVSSLPVVHGARPNENPRLIQQVDYEAHVGQAPCHRVEHLLVIGRRVLRDAAAVALIHFPVLDREGGGVAQLQSPARTKSDDRAYCSNVGSG